MHQITGFSKQ